MHILTELFVFACTCRDEHEQDFVFEEFVRLRITGMDETETDA